MSLATLFTSLRVSNSFTSLAVDRNRYCDWWLEVCCHLSSSLLISPSMPRVLTILTARTTLSGPSACKMALEGLENWYFSEVWKNTK